MTKIVLMSIIERVNGKVHVFAQKSNDFNIIKIRKGCRKMKKLVSILLALVMVLSMGTIAFADETTTAEATTAEATTAEATTAEATTAEATTAAPADDLAVTVGEIVDIFKQIFANVDIDTIKGVYEETKVTIEGLADVIAPLFGSESGTPSFSLAEVPAMLMNAFIDGIAGLFGTDRESIIDKLLEIPFVKEIMGWYGYKPAETVPATEAETEAPATEVPETGATAGIAAFAALSVAAAAAFVSKKKEA